MTRPRSQVWIWATCLCLTACLGKTGQPEPERFPISGTVTFDGRPLVDGLIVFKSVAAGAIDSLEIKNGKFAGKAQAGQRRVEICAYEATGSATKVAGPAGPPPTRNLIPAQYNQESKLKATVTREGPNQFTFQLSR